MAKEKTISRKENRRITLSGQDWLDIIHALGVADGVYDSIKYGAIGERIAKQLFKKEIKLHTYD